MAAKGLHVAEPPAGDEQGSTILIADDDPDILFLLRRLLQKEGYDVVTAVDGVEALRLAGERRPDLLLLDVSMPGKDGYAVCRELEATGSGAPPVIFLTAHAHTAARVKGLDAGAVDYITKPFEHDELKARVRAALRTKTEKDALAKEAAKDVLTGLSNRSQLEVRLAEAIAEAGRSGRPLSCLMIDLDHFKRINDTHGHSAGDIVLVEAADRFRRVMRASDFLLRYGGEEFLALLPDTDVDGAVALAERLREVLSQLPIRVARDGQPAIDLLVQASVGVGSWQDTLIDPAGLVARVDEALYRAKQAGRDRIEVAPGSRPRPVSMSQ